jgi:hypothetical protein
MDPDRIIWSGRPCPGVAWRPQDLSSSLVTALWAPAALFIGYGSNWFFFTLVLLAAGYALLGRFVHDAHLRRRIRYELSTQGLAVWIDGRHAPECVFDLYSLRNVKPQFVIPSGRGTIELPPGGWAERPEWINRWDRDVPAMYPCRRLELIEGVEAVAELIRREARATPDGSGPVFTFRNGTPVR